MARSPKLVLQGGKATIRKLKRLSDAQKLANKVVRSATTASSQVVVVAVRKIWRAEAKDSGLSARSVTKKVIKTKAGFLAIVGIDKDAEEPRPGRTAKLGNPKRHIPANIDHLIELGFQHPNGKTVPAVAPLRRGHAASKVAAEKKFEQKAAAAIVKEATKK